MPSLPKLPNFLRSSQSPPMSREEFTGLTEEVEGQARHKKNSLDVKGKLFRVDGKSHMHTSQALSKSAAHRNKRCLDRAIKYLEIHGAEYAPEQLARVLPKLKELKGRKEFSPAELALALRPVSPAHERSTVKAGVTMVAREVHAWMQAGSPERAALVNSPSSSDDQLKKAQQIEAAVSKDVEDEAKPFLRFFGASVADSPEAKAIERLTEALQSSAVTRPLSPQTFHASLVELPRRQLDNLVDGLNDLVQRANGPAPSPELLQEIQKASQDVIDFVNDWMTKLTRVIQLLAVGFPSHLPVPEQRAWLDLANSLLQVAQACTAPHGLAHTSLRFALRKQQQVTELTTALAVAAVQDQIHAVQERVKSQFGVQSEEDVDAQLAALKQEQQEQQDLRLKALEDAVQGADSASVATSPKGLEPALLHRPIRQARPKQPLVSTVGNGTLKARQWAADLFAEVEGAGPQEQNDVHPHPALELAPRLNLPVRSTAMESLASRIADGGPAIAGQDVLLDPPLNEPVRQPVVAPLSDEDVSRMVPDAFVGRRMDEGTAQRLDDLLASIDIGGAPSAPHPAQGVTPANGKPWAEVRQSEDRRLLTTPIRSSRRIGTRAPASFATQADINAFESMFSQMDRANVSLATRPGRPLEEPPVDEALSREINELLDLPVETTEPELTEQLRTPERSDWLSLGDVPETDRRRSDGPNSPRPDSSAVVDQMLLARSPDSESPLLKGVLTQVNAASTGTTVGDRSWDQLSAEERFLSPDAKDFLLDDDIEEAFAEQKRLNELGKFGRLKERLFGRDEQPKFITPKLNK